MTQSAQYSPTGRLLPTSQPEFQALGLSVPRPFAPIATDLDFVSLERRVLAVLGTNAPVPN